MPRKADEIKAQKRKAEQKEFFGWLTAIEAVKVALMKRPIVESFISNENLDMDTKPLQKNPLKASLSWYSDFYLEFLE